jgi:hypothetical protein
MDSHDLAPHTYLFSGPGIVKTKRWIQIQTENENNSWIQHQHILPACAVLDCRNLGCSMVVHAKDGVKRKTKGIKRKQIS